MGLPTTALAVLLQFDCYLRPRELAAISSHQYAFPHGIYLGSQAKHTLVLLPNTKTGPLQSVAVRLPLIVQQLKRLTTPLAPNIKIFPPYHSYRIRLLQALKFYNLQHIGYSPHSIRHGAATMDLINKGEDALSGILYRGRWESAAGRIYLQSGAAALLLAAVPQHLLLMARRCESELQDAFEKSSLQPGV